MKEQGAVLIAGASGLVGRALCAALAAQGREVRRLVRREARPEAGEFSWNPAENRLDPAALHGVTALVNLSGESIGDGRWSAARKERLRASRLDSTRLLASAVVQSGQAPGVFLSASACGYYGDCGEAPASEETPCGAGFLAALAKDWEEAAGSVQAAGWRLVHPRFGVILAQEGGVFPRLREPGAWGLGARLGSGRQWQSLVHLEDVVAALLFLLARPDLAGAFNLTAPAAVRQAAFADALARAQKRPRVLVVPAFVLRLALGEMAQELLLASCRAQPARLEAQGFRFRYPTLDTQLAALLAP